MNFADNWARVFVVITFLTFGEAQIIGGIVPNLIAFGLFLGAIGSNPEHTRRISKKLFLEGEIARKKEASAGGRPLWLYGPKTFPTSGK